MPSEIKKAQAAAPQTLTRLTKEQAAVISAFTGVMCGNFGDLVAYAETKFPQSGGLTCRAMLMLADQLREKARPDFLAMQPEGAV